MNLKHISLLLIGTVVLLFSSCNGNTNTVFDESSSNAQISSISFAASHTVDVTDLLASETDSLMCIELPQKNFGIDQLSGHIYNPDSLNYGAILKKFFVTVTYPVTPASLQVILPDTSYFWNSKDSIDFSKSPVYFKVMAQNGKSKTYLINITVHKVDPDLIPWTQTTSLPNAAQQKTVLAGNTFFSYSIISGALSLYTGSDTGALVWTQQPSLSGLPATVDLTSITVFNNHFFALDTSGGSYMSTDGLAWNRLSNGRGVSAIYGILPGANASQDSLLLCVKNGSNYNFATTQDLSTVITHSENFPTDFPIKGFGTTTNPSRNISTNMLLLAAGKSSLGADLGSTWLVKNTAHGLEMSPSRSVDNFAGEGNSIFMYANLLYALSGSELYISSSWGASWQLAPEKQRLDANFVKRIGQSVIVDQDHYIWIFGGMSGTNIYLSDVWKGKLNNYPQN